ncbi:myosin regulatory light chain 2, skeletal muscle isoform [Dermochelys coriacea]|uniref:myosin regulatory light chain 2, skeletal muscle isoform n=1 Tax=Dermochelys coriacea TaxID=27794 RepID=UPI001CAA08E6|nr:myosin regulatory light chain 2, skeletal muscle isoform [Dermochelys coriacea]
MGRFMWGSLGAKQTGGIPPLLSPFSKKGAARLGSISSPGLLQAKLEDAAIVSPWHVTPPGTPQECYITPGGLAALPSLPSFPTSTDLPTAAPACGEEMAPKKAKRKAAEGSSNVFSMFDQTQIQEFKEAFTVIDQNRDGIIDKEDLRDTFAAMGRLNVKNEELDAMIKEASGPINFTVFLTMFGEKLKGADPEDVIMGAFKVLDSDAKGTIKKKFLEELLTTQCDRFTPEEIKNMWAAFPPDVAGNVDYKNICYVITHGEDKEGE